MKAHNIYITSMRGGSGCSLIAAHLAIVLYQHNKKVLVVDGDPLNPTQALYYHINENYPAEAYLTEGKSLSQLIQKGLGGVDVLTNLHPIKKNKFDLTAFYNKLDDIKSECSGLYDYIVWDIPALAFVSSSFTWNKRDIITYVGSPGDFAYLSRFIEHYRRMTTKGDMTYLVNGYTQKADVIAYQDILGQDSDVTYLGYVSHDEQGVQEALTKGMLLTYNEETSPIMESLELLSSYYLT
ncbi:tyrosine-protein kinase family protein [Spirochaeta cellobiosiphila]|uniref:tyrosine-protein kinase family protein n=1 Tax=Spirochaeta cellobiosiphila TaxID=504483 RepID=UPI00048C2797|nr:AAA family ATPase [Spirochaeta cellobiosiphila]